MAGSFHHNLYILFPCPFGQFTEADKFFDLTDIAAIGQTSRTAGVAQGNGNVIFATNFEDFIEIFIKRIFFSGHAHPGKNKRTAPGYDIHFSFMFFNLFYGLSGDATVQGDKIYTVFGMEANDV